MAHLVVEPTVVRLLVVDVVVILAGLLHRVGKERDHTLGQ